MTIRILHYSDVENACDTPERVGRLAACIATRRDEDALVVGTGDDTGPGVLSLIEDGAQALDFFRAVDPDAEAFGNHEFDHGPNRARELVAASPQPWVSANVRTSDGERFGAAEGVVPWTVAEADGTTVGFVGVTTPETANISATVEDLRFADPVSAVCDHLPDLRDRAERVVVLAHLADCEPLARLPGVDAVLAGHTHAREVVWYDDTPVVRPGVNGTHVAELRFGPDPDATHLSVAEAPVDEEVADALAVRVAESELDETVAAVEEPVVRTERAAFCAESRLGNLVTDAYRWATDADVGLCSAGGVRTGDPLADDVRAMDLVSVVPFDQRLLVGELPGHRLRETFAELRLRERYPDAPPEYVGHVSGAHLRWDGGDLESVEVGGEPLDPDRTYTFATDSYSFETDHLFSSFNESDCVRSWGKQYEALVAYARETGVAPRRDGRVRCE